MPIGNAGSSRKPRQPRPFRTLISRRCMKSASQRRLIITMELIDGRKLSDVLEGRPLSIGRALELTSEIAEGLARAHEKNVVHRDIKPANLMVTADGHAKIIDFGLAKLVEPSAPIQMSRRSRTIPRQASSSEPQPTCRPSRRAGMRSIIGPTSSRSASCSSRWWMGAAPFRAQDRHGYAQRHPHSACSTVDGCRRAGSVFGSKCSASSIAASKRIPTMGTKQRATCAPSSAA